jgi:hypothetical protein
MLNTNSLFLRKILGKSEVRFDAFVIRAFFTFAQSRHIALISAAIYHPNSRFGARPWATS